MSADGQNLSLHYTGSTEVPINSGSHTNSLIKGLNNAGADLRVALFSGSSNIETRSGFICDRTGSVGIKIDETTAPLSYALDVSGSIRATGTVLQSSDERLKENIYPIDNSLDRINAIDGVYFNWKDKEERNAGVIAQQVQKVLPEVVSEDKNGYLNVDYGGIVPLLLEAIKELESRVNELENK